MDHIGALAAEQDTQFLQSCFVDTGAYALAQAAGDNRVIIVGRTGTGKSAILRMLESQHGTRVVRIEPENIALTYVSNSTVLNFFADIGVNLDPFFKLLWRHVITVELLNHHFQDRNDHCPKESDMRAFAIALTLCLRWLGDSCLHGSARQGLYSKGRVGFKVNALLGGNCIHMC